LDIILLDSGKFLQKASQTKDIIEIPKCLFWTSHHSWAIYSPRSFHHRLEDQRQTA